MSQVVKPILFCVRHYPPDFGAPSYRLQHAAEVVARDHTVRVLAAQPNRYPGAPPAPRLEERNGVRIHRIWHGQLFKGRGKFSRGIAEIVGAIWMALIAVLHYRQSTAVVVSTPPLFYSFPGWVLHKLCGVSLVVDLRDLWLDWAEESGTIRSGILLKLLRRYERSLLGSARHITVTTRAFKQIISERFRIDRDKITVIYNGLDEFLQHEEIRVQRPAEKRSGVRRILYAGNMGPSQNLLGILDGCRSSVHKWPHLEILVVGDGTQWSAMKARETGRLAVMRHVDREELKALYESADAFILHLAALNVYQHTVPSKLFEYVSYQKPILVGVTGEARSLCRQYVDCYEFVSDNSSSLAQAVDRFMQGKQPDNAGSERADIRTVLRASRDPFWKQVSVALCR